LTRRKPASKPAAYIARRHPHRHTLFGRTQGSVGMGFISNVVSTVVTVVENATGNQDSGAGDWTEEQAGQAEDAADAALGAVSDATSDALDFGKLLGQNLEGKLGSWLLGTGGRIGLNGLSPLDLGSVLGLGSDVLELTARRIGTSVEQKLPGPVVDASERLTGVAARGPAAVWAEVKTELHGGTVVLGKAGGKVRNTGSAVGGKVVDTAGKLGQWAGDKGSAVGGKVGDTAGKLGRWAGDKGSAVGGKVGDTAGKLGQWAGDKGSAVGGKVGDTVGKLGRWGDDKLAHAQTLDKLRHWGAQLGTRVNDAAPAETLRELARRADDERARLIDALRRAAATVPAQTGRPTWHPEPPPRARSHRPESIELRRLTATLVKAAPAGAGRAAPETARHMAVAADAAVRSAVLQAQLLLWLAAIKRLSRQSRQHKRH
jgi:hypothetical protein